MVRLREREMCVRRERKKRESDRKERDQSREEKRKKKEERERRKKEKERREKNFKQKKFIIAFVTVPLFTHAKLFGI